MSDRLVPRMTSGFRGAFPLVPDKPPSVAERTRLLRSSFRKEDIDKPILDTTAATSLKNVVDTPTGSSLDNSLPSSHNGNHHANSEGLYRSPSPATCGGSSKVRLHHPSSSSSPDHLTSVTETSPVGTARCKAAIASALCQLSGDGIFPLWLSCPGFFISAVRSVLETCLSDGLYVNIIC